MIKIIDGKILAEKIKDQVVSEVERVCQASKMIQRRPNLAIILVGNREDSRLYVSMKEKEAKKVGIDINLYCFDQTVLEKDVLETINFLNHDQDIDAILVQLPLPDNFDTDKIIKTINPDKDVDGFHPENIKKLLTGEKEGVVSPVFAAITHCLKDINFNLEKSSVAVISKSEVFGGNLAKFLTLQKADAQLIFPDDVDFKNKIKKADVVISAIGKKNLITKELIKKDAVLIDVGIDKKGKKVYGDIDFESVQGVASYLTPVPGGIGPLTIAMLFENVLFLYQKNQPRRD